MDEFPLEPLDDRLIVKPLDAEKVSRGGIVIPDGVREDKPRVGIVLAVGPGRVLDNGAILNVPFAPGDRILYGKYTGSDFKIDGVTILILRAGDVLARIRTQPTPEASSDGGSKVRIDEA